jgi:hypothetical protein
MPNQIAVRASRGGLITTRSDRAFARELTAIQTAALIRRATDAASRDLTLARLSDTGIATRHALGEADEIIGDLERRVEGRPFALAALAPIAEDGVVDLRRELRHLSEGR